MIVSGIRLITYEYVVTLNSGASGHGWLVSAAPPVLCLASRTTVLAPARARYAPATRPLCPPPMTTASYTFGTSTLQRTRPPAPCHSSPSGKPMGNAIYARYLTRIAIRDSVRGYARQARGDSGRAIDGVRDLS